MFFYEWNSSFKRLSNQHLIHVVHPLKFIRTQHECQQIEDEIEISINSDSHHQTVNEYLLGNDTHTRRICTQKIVASSR